MRFAGALRLLLLVLLVTSPFDRAVTTDAWVEGIQDAESDNVLQAVIPTEGVIAHAPPHAFGHVHAVLALLHLAEESPTSTAPAQPLNSRAPPRI